MCTVVLSAGGPLDVLSRTLRSNPHPCETPTFDTKEAHRTDNSPPHMRFREQTVLISSISATSQKSTWLSAWIEDEVSVNLTWPGQQWSGVSELAEKAYTS